MLTRLDVQRPRSVADRPTLEAIAYHEAGHALAATLVATVWDITIVPVPGVSRGLVRTQSRGMHNPGVWRDLVRAAADEPLRRLVQATALGHARYCLAGWAGESLHVGRLPAAVSKMVGEKDTEDARSFIRAAYPDMPLGCPAEHWILDGEYGRTRRFLQEHRKHLDAVASALLKLRTLDGDDLEAILDHLPPIREPRFRH